MEPRSQNRFKREAEWFELARDRVLELLDRGPARVTDIAHALGGDDHRTHRVMRGLRDEGLVYTDKGYWVLGTKQRHW